MKILSLLVFCTAFIFTSTVFSYPGIEGGEREGGGSSDQQELKVRLHFQIPKEDIPKEVLNHLESLNVYKYGVGEDRDGRDIAVVVFHPKNASSEVKEAVAIFNVSKLQADEHGITHAYIDGLKGFWVFEYDSEPVQIYP